MNEHIDVERDRFAPSDITVKDRARGRVDEDAVIRLMASIKEIGLQTPPTVRWDLDADGGDEIILVAGRHRVEACRRLGMALIECIVVRGDQRTSRMWEIAENLHRADLTALERSEHVAEWVRLSDAAHIAPHEKAGQKPGGINAATRHLGIERTQAQRAVKISSLADEAKQQAIASGLDDNASVLCAAAKQPSAEAQILHIKKEADKKEAHKRNRDTDRAIVLTNAQQFAEWLMRRTDLNELPIVIGWLEGTKPKDVISALRRQAA